MNTDTALIVLGIAFVLVGFLLRPRGRRQGALSIGGKITQKIEGASDKGPTVQKATNVGGEINQGIRNAPAKGPSSNPWVGWVLSAVGLLLTLIGLLRHWSS